VSEKTLREKLIDAAKAADAKCKADAVEAIANPQPPKFDINAITSGTAGFDEPDNADDW
jgi:hypothetical protein